jgi:hypothetical protein
VNCPTCGGQLSSDSYEGGLSYFCGNPRCEEYDEYLNGLTREEALQDEDRVASSKQGENE